MTATQLATATAARRAKTCDALIRLLSPVVPWMKRVVLRVGPILAGLGPAAKPSESAATLARLLSHSRPIGRSQIIESSEYGQVSLGCAGGGSGDRDRRMDPRPDESEG